MKVRYSLFEHKETGVPLVVRAGWSWFAFTVAPLWAASNGIWAAAAGMSILGCSLAYALVTGHPTSTVLLIAWIMLSWWMGDDGQRWVTRRTVARFGEGKLAYLGGAIASSKVDAENQARNSIAIRERFYAAARNAPPEHVALAREMLDRDAAL
jgi:hypothetical protein